MVSSFFPWKTKPESQTLSSIHKLYEHQRVLVTRGKFLKVYGKLQNQDGVVHVKAELVELLQISAINVRSHDFH